MPMFDRVCIDPNCNTEIIDCLEPIKSPTVLCKACGKETERAWISKPAGVIGDDIPGGIWIRHGVCNEDGTPRKYYSKSEIAREAERRGLVSYVEHIPLPGSDKAKHTVRWTGTPLPEDIRLKEWWEHERRLVAEVAKTQENT